MSGNEWWIPAKAIKKDGEERRVGIELEFSGLTPQEIASAVVKTFGGQVVELTRYELLVKDSEFGQFKVELDASSLKALADKMDTDREPADESSFESFASDLLTKAAEQVVPWELVCPPIKFSELYRLPPLVDTLREAGAQGTRDSFLYAFGLHLNPELPATDVDTILAYLRAYLCLYDWIVEQDQIDLTRRLTSYINHFGKDYILKVIDPAYHPTQDQMIDDYIQFNPTRNRSMDMLPMFAHLDEGRVRQKLDDPRINPRPTLHFRLPNCDIGNPKWNLDSSWQSWLQVERLANHENDLNALCREYTQFLRSFAPSFDKDWLKACTQWVSKADH